MNNKEIAKNFSLLGKLLEIHNEDSFKARAYGNASFRISQLDNQLSNIPEKQVSTIPGIGSAIAQKISELLKNGRLNDLEDLKNRTPEGIWQMLNIKGLGAKKIHTIWKDMCLENIDELLEAINEDLLIKYPGFGKKTQQNIKEAIGFYISQSNKLLYGQIEHYVLELNEFFNDIFYPQKFELTGEVRRHAEIVSEIEFISDIPIAELIKKLDNNKRIELTSKGDDFLEFKDQEDFIIKIYSSSKEDFPGLLFNSTGPLEFISDFSSAYPEIDFLKCTNEKDIFMQSGIQFIPPFLRDTTDILELARENKIPAVIQPQDICGLIHCHTTWSDAVDTIEEMALGCKARGLEYMVLSDHSKAAFYANGLDEKRVTLQQKEVDQLNNKLAPFKIFKSIECDILSDGTLDYTDEMLRTFDLVIASVHSNLKMTDEKATNRLLKAIENPFTTILGHMTGRLLLRRNGYMPDHKRIIDACAINHVVIEINANPRRLDMRWQWVPYALSKNVLLSINPDAHSIAEIDNNRYGVFAAQKGLLTKERNLSSFSLKEFEQFLKQKTSF